MSDNITQSFGIDAAQALQALAALDKGFASFEARLNSIGKSVADFNRATAGIDKLGASVRNNLPAATRDVENLTVSWGTLSRVVATQFIVRAMSQFRDVVRATIKDTIELQRQIALITTIDQSGTGVAQLTNSVRDLSDNLNLPILEAAKGVYQAISNQVGDFGESLKFTAEAAEFAKATNSSLTNSVDLLSGVLKSYNLDAADTNKVSTSLFKVIDLGRVSADQLANSFGRVGPVSAELGVSIDELGAAVSTISVNGSNTAESLTQFRAVLTGLQKPTKETQKVLRDLGFSSAETSIKTLGLGGTLSALADSTGGSAEAMARLFPNVRGLSGEVALTSDNLKSFTSNLNEMTAAGRNFAKESFLKATATDGERVTRELNKIKNALTVDLGNALVKTAADFSQFIGGADSITAAAKTAGPAILGLGGSFLIFRGQVLAASSGLTTFSKALGALSLVPLAAGLGQSIGEGINSRLIEARFRDLKELQALNKSVQADFVKQQEAARDSAQAADQDRAKSALLTIQGLNKTYLADVSNAQNASEALTTNTTAALGKIVTTREKLVAELGKAVADSESIARNAVSRIDGLNDRKTDIDFNQRISGFDDAQKSFALAKRAQDIAREAGDKLAKAVDTDSVQKAVALFAKAQQTGEAAAEIAARTGDTAAIARSAQEQKRLIDQQLDAERQLLQLQDQRQAKLEREQSKQQQIVDSIRSQVKLALDNTGLFNASGQQFNAADQAKREAARQNALKRVAELSLSQNDLNATSALGLADFVSKFQADLSRNPVALQFSVDKSTAEIKAKLDQAFANFKIQAPIDVGAVEKALGRTLSNPDQISQALTDMVSKAAELRTTIDQALAGDQRAKGLKAELDTIVQGINLDKPATAFADNLTPRLEGIVQQLGKLRNDADLTEADLQSLIAVRERFRQDALAGENPVMGRLIFDTDIVAMDAAINRLIKIQQLQQTGTGELRSQLLQVEQVIGTIDPTARFQSAASAIGQGVTPAQAIAAAFKSSADDAERTARAAASLGGNVARRQFGGGYFADGGVARGVDTVPAMLSKGEFVMNPAASSRFFSQIQAMNAGQTPVFRDNGGTVNNNLGDIHIHAASNPEVTGRSVIDKIKRELRKGTRSF